MRVEYYLFENVITVLKCSTYHKKKKKNTKIFTIFFPSALHYKGPILSFMHLIIHRIAYNMKNMPTTVTRIAMVSRPIQVYTHNAPIILLYFTCMSRTHFIFYWYITFYDFFWRRFSSSPPLTRADRTRGILLLLEKKKIDRTS